MSQESEAAAERDLFSLKRQLAALEGDRRAEAALVEEELNSVDREKDCPQPAAAAWDAEALMVESASQKTSELVKIVVSGVFLVLLSFTGFYWVIPGLTGNDTGCWLLDTGCCLERAECWSAGVVE